jgi:dienelactone hydrolase
VHNSSAVSAAAALLTLTGVCFAQPPGVTREMIMRALPVEGAPLAVPGPYAATSEPAFGSPGHVVFRPTDLAAFPADDTLPVMVWGNGGCASNVGAFAGFVTTIASHGFLVVSTAALEGAAPGARATADNLRAAIDWAQAENKRAGAPLEGKIAIDRIAVMGTSCGGFLAVGLGADPRVDTIGSFNSGVSPPNPDGSAGPFPTTAALADLHGPVLLLNGGEPDFMTDESAANYEAIGNVPVFYGARDNAGHAATFFHEGGGEFANVTSRWLMWILKDDQDAGAMFAGEACGLCTNPNWDTKSKGFE